MNLEQTSPPSRGCFETRLTCPGYMYPGHVSYGLSVYRLAVTRFSTHIQDILPAGGSTAKLLTAVVAYLVPVVVAYPSHALLGIPLLNLEESSFALQPWARQAPSPERIRSTVIPF